MAFICAGRSIVISTTAPVCSSAHGAHGASSRGLPRRTGPSAASISAAGTPQASAQSPAVAVGERRACGVARRRAAEARRRRRLLDAVDAHEAAALDVVRVARRLRPATAPARSRRRCLRAARTTARCVRVGEDRGEPAAAARASGRGRRSRAAPSTSTPAAASRSSRTRRNLPSIGATETYSPSAQRVDVVERRARVEQVGAARPVVQAGRRPGRRTASSATRRRRSSPRRRPGPGRRRARSTRR